MATVKQYALQLWDIQSTVAAKLGCDIRYADLSLRAGLMAVDVTIAVILKLLVDNQGVITDGQLNTAGQNIKNATFPQLPVDVPLPGDGSSAPPPDLG